MNTKIKKTICACLAVASLTCITATTASAYWDGDREVGYYDFNLSIDSDDDYYEYTSDPITRLYDRNWVVSVNDVTTTVYPITYSVGRSGAADMPTGYSATLKGTGNTGAAYYPSTPTNIGIRLSGNLSIYETDNIRNGAYSSGQWSPDAPAT